MTLKEVFYWLKNDERGEPLTALLITGAIVGLGAYAINSYNNAQQATGKLEQTTEQIEYQEDMKEVTRERVNTYSTEKAIKDRELKKKLKSSKNYKERNKAVFDSFERK